MLRLRHFLLENRVDFVKKRYPQIDSSHDAYAIHRDSGPIVDHFAEKADPSKKKQYTDWIVNRYGKGDFRQEDHARVRTALENFERYKGKLQQKDINQYKRLSHLEDAVEPHLGGVASNKEAKRAAKHEGADLVYDDGDVSVHRLKTHEAACHYGAGTKWCTAARDDPSMFDHYSSRGPIYVIQKGGRKWQLHHNSEQLMDEKDEPVSPKELVKKIPQLRHVGELSDAKDADGASSRMTIHFMSDDRANEYAKRVADDIYNKEQTRGHSMLVVRDLAKRAPQHFEKIATSMSDGDHRYNGISNLMLDHTKQYLADSHPLAKLMVDDPSPAVRAQVASVHPDLAEKLIHDSEPEVVASASTHPGAVRKIAADVRHDRFNFPMDDYSRSYVSAIRANAAKHCGELFVDHPEKRLRKIAAGNPDMAHHFVGDRDEEVREKAASHPEHAHLFANDPKPDVRAVAANVSLKAAHEMKNDSHPSVRSIAASWLDVAPHLVNDKEDVVSRTARDTITWGRRHIMDRDEKGRHYYEVF